jgi:hypothetical protein
MAINVEEHTITQSVLARRRSPVGARPSASRGGPRRARGAATPPSWRTNWRALGIYLPATGFVPPVVS